MSQKTSQQREETGQSRKQALRPERNAIEVAGLEHGLARLNDGLPLSSRLLRDIHGQLLAQGRGTVRLPGEFRCSQNWIGATRAGNAHFVPPPPGHLEDCLA
jgi:Fic family protein